MRQQIIPTRLNLTGLCDGFFECKVFVKIAIDGLAVFGSASPFAVRLQDIDSVEPRNALASRQGREWINPQLANFI
jgi:hypothetical protein